MKKKIIILLLGIFIFPVAIIYSQEVEKYLNEARAAYSAGRLEEARFSLQQAVNEVDLALAREILALLPDRMGDMPFVDEDETVGSASLGFAGLFVSRTYREDEDLSCNLQIIADSPMLAGINAMISLPMFGSDPNRKRIRVAGYRGILNRNEDGQGRVSWDIQMPFGSSLMTVNFEGVNDENQVMQMINSIEVEKIARMLQ